MESGERVGGLEEERCFTVAPLRAMCSKRRVPIPETHHAEHTSTTAIYSVKYLSLSRDLRLLFLAETMETAGSLTITNQTEDTLGVHV